MVYSSLSHMLLFSFPTIFLLLFVEIFYLCFSLPSSLAEEAGRHKLAAQYIKRELRDADEANLIDEEGTCFSSFFTLGPDAWRGR